MSLIPDWSKAYKTIDWVATYKQKPEDFKVTEILSFPFEENSGEHLYLLIEKTALTTSAVIQLLADRFDVERRDIGYAGQKDKWAVTQQWFSVWLPGKQDQLDITRLADFETNCRLLQARWHRAKLRRGAIESNVFELVLRGQDKIPEEINSRLKLLSTSGYPNYFGPQRFGWQGQNIKTATDWFQRKIKIKKPAQGILLSAVRSYLFNLILQKRIELDNWNKPVAGDCFVLEGSRKYFTSDKISEENRQRCEALDIHPSASLWGRGRNDACLEALEIEQEVLHEQNFLCNALEHKGVTADRRAMRCIPKDLSWKVVNEKELHLAFSLASGSYASSLLKELGDITEPVNRC